ncbi:FHA domain-containing protein [Actinoallomurus acaciae]|uniref:FHA domain-containing protein n=1 Tax=Actinoallomurus acaciae TaxID=502577 RepID=A0ABV5YA97_9ACTN
MPSASCTQCGHTNPDGARFCSNCGTPLTHGVPPVTDEPGDSTSTMSFSAIEAAVAAEQADEPAADQVGVESLPPNTALLLVKRGPNAGSRFLLDQETTSAGRHPESDIFLDDVTVSRGHAEFYRQGERFSVRDMGSLNGTYVNRQRIDETALSSGDEVQIGKFRLVYLSNALERVPVGATAATRPPRRGWWGRWRR